jgi:hypothetical protein
MNEHEIERLLRIERLAREAVRPNPPDKHREALAALRKALADGPPPPEKEARRAAVTQRLIHREK